MPNALRFCVIYAFQLRVAVTVFLETRTLLLWLKRIGFLIKMLKYMTLLLSLLLPKCFTTLRWIRDPLSQGLSAGGENTRKQGARFQKR